MAFWIAVPRLGLALEDGRRAIVADKTKRPTSAKVLDDWARAFDVLCPSLLDPPPRSLSPWLQWASPRFRV